MPGRNTGRKYLPAAFTRLDLPIPNQLVLRHSQKVVPDQENLFDTTSRALMKPLLDRGNYKFQHFEPWFYSVAKHYQCWFTFDRAYHFMALKWALEADKTEISMCRVVARYPAAMHMFVDAILMVRDCEVLEKYAEQTPVLGWLSMIAIGQPEDETWSYVLLPPRRVKHD
jgi:hypothetical protein